MFTVLTSVLYAVFFVFITVKMLKIIKINLRKGTVDELKEDKLLVRKYVKQLVLVSLTFIFLMFVLFFLKFA
jgi:hypothetical protein